MKNTYFYKYVINLHWPQDKSWYSSQFLGCELHLRKWTSTYPVYQTSTIDSRSWNCSTYVHSSSQFYITTRLTVEILKNTSTFIYNRVLLWKFSMKTTPFCFRNIPQNKQERHVWHHFPSPPCRDGCIAPNTQALKW